MCRCNSPHGRPDWRLNSAAAIPQARWWVHLPIGLPAEPRVSGGIGLMVYAPYGRAGIYKVLMLLLLLFRHRCVLYARSSVVINQMCYKTVSRIAPQAQADEAGLT